MYSISCSLSVRLPKLGSCILFSGMPLIVKAIVRQPGRYVIMAVKV